MTSSSCPRGVSPPNTRVDAETLNDRPGSKRTGRAAASRTTAAPAIKNTGDIRVVRDKRFLTKKLCSLDFVRTSLLS